MFEASKEEFKAKHLTKFDHQTEEFKILSF